METWQLICAFGIPSALFTASLALITKCFKACMALKLGVQAMLRAEMVRVYNYWYPKGEVPLHVKDNFENCWKQYEALGANGVMSDIHDKFMDLPISAAQK